MSNVEYAHDIDGSIIVPKNGGEMNHKDMIESVSEELQIMGFTVCAQNNKIIVDTIAGNVSVSISEKTVMGNVYRIISHVGSKLHKWALHLKIEENK